jgi:hypothetical protein
MLAGLMIFLALKVCKVLGDAKMVAIRWVKMKARKIAFGDPDRL